MRRRKIVIPNEMLAQALRDEIVGRNELSLYIYFQLFTDGIFKLDGRLRAQGLRETGLSSKTFRLHLNSLLTKNWLGINPHSKYYFIRSRKFISSITGYQLKRGFEFDYISIRKKMLFPLRNLHLIAFSNGIAVLCKRMKSVRSYKAKQEDLRRIIPSVDKNRVTTLQDGSTPEAPEGFTSYQPLSISLLGNHMGLSTNTVRKYKEACLKHNLIKVKKDILVLSHSDAIDPIGMSVQKGRLSDATITSHGTSYVIMTSRGLISQSADVICAINRIRKLKRKQKCTSRNKELSQSHTNQ